MLVQRVQRTLDCYLISIELKSLLSSSYSSQTNLSCIGTILGNMSQLLFRWKGCLFFLTCQQLTKNSNCVCNYSFQPNVLILSTLAANIFYYFICLVMVGRLYLQVSHLTKQIITIIYM